MNARGYGPSSFRKKIPKRQTDSLSAEVVSTIPNDDAVDLQRNHTDSSRVSCPNVCKSMSRYRYRCKNKITQALRISAVDRTKCIRQYRLFTYRYKQQESTSNRHNWPVNLKLELYGVQCGHSNNAFNVQTIAPRFSIWLAD